VRVLSYGYLCEMLSDLPTDSSDVTIENNLDLIRELGEPRTYLQIASEILNDNRLLTETAGRSYRHVNHFDKLVLIDTGRQNGYRLTLHLWDPPYTEAQVRDELIHDHRFSFWSTILTGTLVSENFQESPEGALYRQYRYVPEKSALASVSNFYEFVGEMTLQRVDPSRKATGQAYYLRNVRIHQVLLPHDSMTCTLVLRGPRLRNFSHVYNRSYPRQNTRMTNTMFTPEELSEKLTRLSATVKETRIRT